MLIALAGGAGVGKSLVAKYIREFGYNVVDSDEINRKLLSQSDYIDLLKLTFPEIVVNNEISKNALRQIIFNDVAKRKTLNNLAHPLILNEILKYSLQHEILFVQIPLLISCGFKSVFDIIWVVTAPKKERLKRLISRDGITRELAEQILKAQKVDDDAVYIANLVIDNSRSPEELKAVVHAALTNIPNISI
ncbi:MAG: dephospho-CoA kinase [Christensenellaceae bacterium]|jgi:dephospho-CoA kinase|nr:dephospho-CoA kinase [Christensenellaceae bacterium]